MILAILNLSVTLMSSIRHQVWAQSDLRFGRRCQSKNYKIRVLGNAESGIFLRLFLLLYA